MASKTLVRNGASLLNRFLSNQFLHQNPNPNLQVVSHGLDITPKLFPALTKFQTSFNLPQQNDAESLSKFSSEGFVYPCGLPSLRFFLPDETKCELAKKQKKLGSVTDRILATVPNFGPMLY